MRLVTFLFVLLLFLRLTDVARLLHACTVRCHALLVLAELLLIGLGVIEALDFFVGGLEVLDEVIHHFLFVYLLLFPVPPLFSVLAVGSGLGQAVFRGARDRVEVLQLNALTQSLIGFSLVLLIM